MKLNQDAVNELMERDLLINIGIQYNGQSNVSIKQVEKTISGLKWENICLEERNKVTGFLSVNHPDAYNLHWNVLVNQIKVEIIPCILPRLDALLYENKITDAIKSSVLFDIVNVLVINCYKEYIQSVFYNDMLKIYLEGHLPYGWTGGYPDGKILIY